VKYGKPILDRIIRRDTSLSDAVKCALISFDSTMLDVSVGPPIDLLIYRRDTLSNSSRISKTTMLTCRPSATAGAAPSTKHFTISATILAGIFERKRRQSRAKRLRRRGAEDRKQLNMERAATSAKGQKRTLRSASRMFANGISGHRDAY